MDSQLVGMCECEHTSHFDRDAKTPNGNPAHVYGQNFFDHFMIKVKTSYGTFSVCKDCANDCHQDCEEIR